MRRLLGSVLPAVLLAGALAGCGDDSGTGTDDPAPTASSSPTKGSTGDEVEFELVGMVTETAAGGMLAPDQAAAALTDDSAVQGFNAQFSSDTMKAEVEKAVAAATVPDDMLLYGAVVAIGCDAPGTVFVTAQEQGLLITAKRVPSPLPECFAPMTTVALVLVPASAVS